MSGDMLDIRKSFRSVHEDPDYAINYGYVTHVSQTGDSTGACDPQCCVLQSSLGLRPQFQINA